MENKERNLSLRNAILPDPTAQEAIGNISRTNSITPGRRLYHDLNELERQRKRGSITSRAFFTQKASLIARFENSKGGK